MFLLTLSLAIGCGKKCQQNTTSYTSVTDTQWRLAETNDPDTAKNLTNYNFLIASFNKDFTGALYKVVDNDQANLPAKTFTYNVNVGQSQIKVSYANSVDSSGNGTGGTTDVTYTYSIGTSLTLTDSTGLYYRYVSFQGVILPDAAACTF